jgi:hypothetical protein
MHLHETVIVFKISTTGFRARSVTATGVIAKMCDDGCGRIFGGP